MDDIKQILNAVIAGVLLLIIQKVADILSDKDE
jgi:hypothetical protein